MEMRKLSVIAVSLFTMTFVACGPNDGDIKASIEEKLKAKPETVPTMVSVSKGDATLSGELASQAAKSESETIAKSVKGVKSVTNNITVTQNSSTGDVVVTADEPLKAMVVDAVKDHPGVQATVDNGVITLTGQISKSSLPTLMMKLNSLRPKKITNTLTIK